MITHLNRITTPPLLALIAFMGCGEVAVSAGPTTFKTIGNDIIGDVLELDSLPEDGGSQIDSGADPVDVGGPQDTGSPQDAGPTQDAAGTPDTANADAAIPQDGGAPKTCSSDQECANGSPQACQVPKCAFGLCVITEAANGSPCAGGPCSGAGICNEGQCLGGKAKDCDDANPCTDDACQAATGACGYMPNTKACDDGDACTESDTCALGQCQPGKNKTCGGEKPCIVVTCKPDTGACVAKPAPGACSDGNACTTGDTCAAGQCVASNKSCDDSNPCTDDLCDPKVGCGHKNNSAVCSDVGTCKAGTCAAGKCVVGDKAGCDDNNPCTKDVCVEGKGCVYTAQAEGSACGAADLCQGAATCKAGKCSVGEKLDCDDNNGCTDDKCDPVAGCSWAANKAPCSDGDACTKTDLCKGGKCSGSGAVPCDDGNPCTADKCDTVKGCVHAAQDGAACDDGSLCTEKSVCKGGKCAGGANKCDDGKPCTTDGCLPDSGACSWTAKSGPCDDGNDCTSGDACTNGKCVGAGATLCDDKNVCTKDSCDPASGKCVFAPVVVTKPIPCDDGDKCTVGESCNAGKCATAAATKCDDGNGCTSDTCDKATGKCAFAPASGPCDSGDLCTWGDTCKSGKCIVGTNKTCNDGSPCTLDACVAGKCTYKATAEGAACSDGQACTTGDACKLGKCVPTKNTCSLYKHDFTCGQAGGWQFHNSNKIAVKWAVDNTPAIAALAAYGCTLNLNDGNDYCHSTQGDYCQVPTAYVDSPLIDASAHKGKLRLRFHTYYDLDGPPGNGNPAYDRPRIELRSAGGQLLQSILLSKEANGCSGASCQKKLLVLQRDIDAAAGQKFRIRLRLHEPTNYDNKGAGWFMDQIEVLPEGAAEVCDNGKDDDGDGLVDCKDLDCKGEPICAEVCTDQKDNDFDDMIDCKDPDCANNVACMVGLFKTAFPCGDTSFAYVGAGKNNVSWAVDGSPGSVKAHSGACSLNFNNGVNYCGAASCAGNNNATGGTATTKQAIDATGYKSLKLSLWSGAWVEQTGNFDRGWVQISSDDFKGCVGGNSASCAANVSCNTVGTTTIALPKQPGVLAKWTSVAFDLSKFAGKKLKIRFRFASCDGVQNKNPGWFIDDLLLSGGK